MLKLLRLADDEHVWLLTMQIYASAGTAGQMGILVPANSADAVSCAFSAGIPFRFGGVASSVC